MTINKKQNYTAIFMLLLAIAAALVLLPLFLSGGLRGHDTGFHISNIMGIKECIKSGKIPYILFNTSEFGYGTPLFYSPLPYYAAAFVSLLLDIFKVSGIYIAMRVCHYLVFFFSALIIFKLNEMICKDNFAAFLGAAVYISSAYRLSEIYVRDAFAESFVFLFLPLALLGIEKLAAGDVKSFYPCFFIGVSGLLLSHTATLPFSALFVFAYFLLRIKRILENKALKHIFISGAFSIVSSLFFFSSLITQKSSASYGVFNMDRMASAELVSDSVLPPSDFIMFIENPINGEIRFGIDIFVIILCICALIFGIIKKKNTGETLFFISFTAVFLLFCTEIVPWDKVPASLRFFQFPWRTFVYIVLSVSVLSCLGLLAINERSRKPVSAVISAVIILLSVLYIGDARFTDREKMLSFESGDLSSYQLGMYAEYLPESALNNMKYYFSRNSDALLSNKDGNIDIVYKNGSDMKLSYHGGKAEAELPLVYYKGYKAYYSGGEEIPVSESKNGFAELALSGSGDINVFFEAEPAVKICTYISLVGILLSAFLYLFYIVHKNIEKNKSGC